MVAVLEGNGTTAWNATLPNGITFVTPLSYSFLSAPKDHSLVFTEDHNDNFTALAHFFNIYSNAGNVSYPGYDRESDKKPWEFRATEVLYHLCVNTYETSFSAGNSTTRIVSSSNVPLAVDHNEPVYNTICSAGPDHRTNECNFLNPQGKISYLRDPDAPEDVTKFYAFDRKLGTLVTSYSYFDLMNSFIADGIADNPASWVKQNYVAQKAAVYGEDNLLQDPAQQFENLEVYFNNLAVAISNS